MNFQILYVIAIEASLLWLSFGGVAAEAQKPSEFWIYYKTYENLGETKEGILASNLTETISNQPILDLFFKPPTEAKVTDIYLPIISTDGPEISTRFDGKVEGNEESKAEKPTSLPEKNTSENPLIEQLRVMEDIISTTQNAGGLKDNVTNGEANENVEEILKPKDDIFEMSDKQNTSEEKESPNIGEILEETLRPTVDMNITAKPSSVGIEDLNLNNKKLPEGSLESDADNLRTTADMNGMVNSEKIKEEKLETNKDISNNDNAQNSTFEGKVFEVSMPTLESMDSDEENLKPKLELSEMPNLEKKMEEIKEMLKMESQLNDTEKDTEKVEDTDVEQNEMLDKDVKSLGSNSTMSKLDENLEILELDQLENVDLKPEEENNKKGNISDNLNEQRPGKVIESDAVLLENSKAKSETNETPQANLAVTENPESIESDEGTMGENSKLKEDKVDMPSQHMDRELLFEPTTDNDTDSSTKKKHFNFTVTLPVNQSIQSLTVIFKAENAETEPRKAKCRLMPKSAASTSPLTPRMSRSFSCFEV